MSAMIWLLIFCVGGLAGLVFNVYQRLGRTTDARDWVRDDNSWGMHVGTGPERVLVFNPCLSLFAAFCGAFVVPWKPLHTVGVIVVAVTALVAIAYRFVPLPIPRWTMPRWYRNGDYPVLRTHQLRKQRRAERRRAKARAKEQHHG